MGGLGSNPNREKTCQNCDSGFRYIYFFNLNIKTVNLGLKVTFFSVLFFLFVSLTNDNSNRQASPEAYKVAVC